MQSILNSRERPLKVAVEWTDRSTDLQKGFDRVALLIKRVNGIPIGEGGDYEIFDCQTNEKYNKKLLKGNVCGVFWYSHFTYLNCSD